MTSESADLGDRIGMTFGEPVAQTSLTTGNFPMNANEIARAKPVLRAILAMTASDDRKRETIAMIPLLVAHLQPEFIDALISGRMTV